MPLALLPHPKARVIPYETVKPYKDILLHQTMIAHHTFTLIVTLLQRSPSPEEFS